MRNLPHGKREPTTAENIESRFWEKVKKTNTCWNWQGFCTKSGHAQFQVVDKVSYAYRYSWELHYGKIPNGLNVLHKCDNGRCVRPNHLFLGTQADNVNDMMLKGRRKYKLSNQKAEEIRKKYKENESSLRKLGKEYGVSATQILRIIRGISWG